MKRNVCVCVCRVWFHLCTTIGTHTLYNVQTTNTNRPCHTVPNTFWPHGLLHFRIHLRHIFRQFVRVVHWYSQGGCSEILVSVLNTLQFFLFYFFAASTVKNTVTFAFPWRVIIFGFFTNRKCFFFERLIVRTSTEYNNNIHLFNEFFATLQAFQAIILILVIWCVYFFLSRLLELFAVAFDVLC